MKTIYLLRHAKSSWDDARLTDFERPLNRRGLENAPRVGAKISENRFQIDLIVSSPAERAKQTANIVAEAANVKGEIKFDERIYEASAQSLLKVISETADEKKSVLLVGHNPGLENFIEVLTGKTETMPTAALAVIDLNVDKWNEVTSDCGKLLKLFRPEDD